MNKVDEVPVPTFWLEEAINKVSTQILRLDLGRNKKQVWLEPQKITNSHSNLEEEEQRLIIIQKEVVLSHILHEEADTPRG